MDYSFFNQLEKAEGKQGETVSSDNFNKRLARARRITEAEREPTEEKQKRIEDYNGYTDWVDTVDPESTILDAPVGVYDYMQQDDEEGYGSAHYLSSRTAGTIAGIRDKIAKSMGSIATGFGYEPDLRTFLLQHPKFEEAGPTAETKLGLSIGHIRSIEMKLKSRGLVGNSDQIWPTDVLKSGWDYVKSQVGERALSRIPKGDRSRVLGAIWTQEIIRNSSVEDPTKALDYIIPKVRGQFNKEFAIPFGDNDALFNSGMKKLISVADQLDDTVDESAPFNEAITDDDLNATTRLWYNRITGEEPASDASVDDIMRTIRPYLDIYDSAINKANMAYKWHLAGVDVPLNRIHENGQLFAITELPGVGKAGAELARNTADDVAYENVEDFSRLYASRTIKKNMDNAVEYLRNELGMDDEDMKRIRLARYKRDAIAPRSSRSPGPNRLFDAEDNNERYFKLHTLALADEGLRTALAAKKTELAEEWKKRNEEKIKERALEKGWDPTLVGEFLKRTHEQASEAAKTHKKRQEAYDTSYFYRYGNDLVHAIIGGVTALGGAGGTSREAMMGIHRYLYSSSMGGIPKIDQEVLGERDKGLTDVLREKLAELPFFPKNPNEALNDYLDKVVEDRHTPILDQMGMVFIDALHGIMELPVMALEDPWSMGLMFGAVGKYNKASQGVAHKIARKMGRPGLEAPILAVIRPHEFAANSTRAGKLLLTDRMMFGTSMNKFRRTLNKMSPELRRKYHVSMQELNNDMIKNGGNDVKQMGESIKGAVDELGMKMAEAEYEHKLSRADLAGVRQKALDRDISYEAANALFATPFGNGKLTDGTLSRHITQGAVKSLIDFQNEIIDNVRRGDRSGRSPAELMYELNREFMKFKADRSDEGWRRREAWLRDKLGVDRPEMFDTIRKYFRDRYDHEKSAVFDRDAIEMAVKENQYQVERTSAREKLYRGFQISLEHKIDAVKNKLAAHETMEKTRKNQRRQRALVGGLARLRRMWDMADRDVKTLKRLGKSHIIDPTNANAAMFREFENGWRTAGDAEYQRALMETVTHSSIFNKNTRRRLAKIFHHDETFLGKLDDAAVKVTLGKKPGYAKQKNRVSKVIKKATQSDRITKEVTGLFADNPPFNRAEAVRTARRSMRTLMDYAVKSRNMRGQIGGGLLRPVGDVVNALLVANPGKDASHTLRLITQRVENFAQGPMGLLDRAMDKVRLLSDEDRAQVEELSRMPTDLLNKTQNNRLKQIALDMRLVRDQIIRAQYRAGLITRDEMNKAVHAGTDSHFYLDGQFRGELNNYTVRDRLTVQPESAETPEHGHLNIQRKFGTPRVSWFDRASGKWRIKDFKPKNRNDTAGAIQRAKNYRDSILKKYPGMSKKDIEYVKPLMEEDLAFKGLINKDLDYQIDAMRDMIHDLAKTHLMNEIGMMQGLVRTDVPSNIRDRQAWVRVGGQEGDLTPAQRRQERMKWGSLAGKYVHVSFFDHISAYDDATSVIRGVADSFRDTINEARTRKGGRTMLGDVSRLIQTFEEATGKVTKDPLLQGLMKKASRHIRRNLITMNPAAYVNNFMGALVFSHMAGAKVMSPEFWKGSLDSGNWRNFNKLLDEIGTNEFEQLGTPAGDEVYRRRGIPEDDISALKLFKFAVDRGLVERTDEGVFTGGRRRTGKRLKFTDMFKDIEETTRKKFNDDRRKIRELDNTIQKLDQVIASGEIPHDRLSAFRERRTAFDAMRADLKKRQSRAPLDYHIRATQSLPGRILDAAKKTGTELGRFINTDSESAVHRIFSGWYGNIDPKLKWQTLRYLVEDAGMTKEGALQRVLDYHQNYGTISPFIRNLRNMPLAGSFVPSFPAEAARILKNGFADNIGRTLSPLLATAMWNQTQLAANGQTISDLANLQGGNDDPFGLLRAMVSQTLIADGEGGYYSLDTMKYTPFAPFMRAEGISKPFIEQVQRAGPLGAAVTPLLNFASNFVGNTPTSQLVQKHLGGTDSFTGRVTYSDGVRNTLGSLTKDLAGLYVPKTISRPMEQYNRVRQTPTSTITNRNITALEGTLNTIGINVKSLSKEENVANLALRFMYKRERQAFIKNAISFDGDIKSDIYELNHINVNTTEWQDKLKSITDDLMKQGPDELRIGTEVIKLKKFPENRRKKIVKRIIAKASNNMFNVVEEMAPRRRLHFLRAIKQTWDRDEPAYQHALRTFTTSKFLKKASDIGDLSEVFVEAMEMEENSVDPEFKSDLRSIGIGVAWRVRQLKSNNKDRVRRMARELINATKGDYKKRLMTLFSQYSHLR